MFKKPLGDINYYQVDRIQDLINFVQSYQNEKSDIYQKLKFFDFSKENNSSRNLFKKVSDEEISKKFPNDYF